MSKHTPGPWEWGEHFCGLHGANGEAILEFEDYEGMRFEGSESDARLITAAPRILELLEEARITLEMWKDVAPAVSLCADIDKALAAAKGGD